MPYTTNSAGPNSKYDAGQYTAGNLYGLTDAFQGPSGNPNVQSSGLNPKLPGQGGPASNYTSSAANLQGPQPANPYAGVAANAPQISGAGRAASGYAQPAATGIGVDTSGNSTGALDSGRTSPDDWINLQRYFGLNSGAGQSMANTLVNPGGGQPGVAGAVSPAQRDIEGIAGGANFNPLQVGSDIDAANNALNRLTSQYGRESMFQGTAKGNYSQGDSRLDSFLSGAGAQGYANSVGDLAQQFGSAVDQGANVRANQPSGSSGGIQSLAPGQAEAAQDNGQTDAQDWAQQMGYTVNPDGTVRVPKVGGGYTNEDLNAAWDAYKAQHGGK